MSKRKNPLPPDQKDSPWQDYSDCTFKWLWNRRPKPEQVRYMVEERAFHSMGKDEDLIAKQWNRPLRGDPSRTEASFARTSNDICCADTVGFVAYQSSVVDFLAVPGFGVHAVDPYMPTPDKAAAGKIKFVARYGPDNTEHDKPQPQDDFLPGDFFIYCRLIDNWGKPYSDPPRARIEKWLAGDTKNSCGDHIDMYLGEFAEVDDKGNPVTDGGRTFHVINGSYDKGIYGTYVVPLHLDAAVRGSIWHGSTPTGAHVVHGRFIPIERLFQDSLGPPFRVRQHKVMSGGAPAPAPPVDPKNDLAAFWSQIKGAKAPYPIGKSFAWHQGVHLLAPNAADDPEEVVAMAKGEIIAARAVGTTPEGDTGFVLMRHLYARDKKEILDPTTLDTKDGKVQPLPATVLPFFSLYMHLAPIDDVSLGLDKGEPPVSYPWLSAVRPRDVPEHMVPHGTPITLVAMYGDSGDPSVLGTFTHTVASDLDLGNKDDQLEALKAEGDDYYLLSQGADTYRDLWAAHPTPKQAKGKLVFVDTRSGHVYPTTQDLGTNVFLHHAPDPIDATKEKLDIVATVKGVDYARVDAYTRPAVATKDPLAGELATVTGDDAVTFLTLPPKGAKLRLHLDTTGVDGARKLVDAHVDLSLSQVVDADAEAARRLEDDSDPSHHTTLVVKAAPVAVPAEPYFWLDLVPCVAQDPAKTASIESDLSGIDKAYARDADARLTRGATRLVVAIVGTGDDAEWTADEDDPALITAGSSAAIYLHLTPARGGFATDTDPAAKPLKDHPDWRFAPTGLAGTKLRALAVVKDPSGKNRPSRALLEVAWAVKKSDAKAALQTRVDAANADNKVRTDIAKSLSAGDVVDFRKRFKAGTTGDSTLPAELLQARAPLGRAGRLLAELGGDGTTWGIHFEVFAGQPLATDAEVKPSTFPEKALTKVAGSPWLAFKDSAKADLTAAILDTLVTEIGKLVPAPTLATDSLKRISVTPLSPDEWTAFYDANDRFLSRVVSVHESEWTSDWATAAKAGASRRKPLLDEKEGDVDRIYDALAWMSKVEFIPEDKLDDPSAYVFHHPARLIEYLRTRLEVSLTSVTKDGAKDATVTFTLGDSAPDKITLTNQGAGRFAALVAVSDAPNAPPTTGTLSVTFKGGKKPITVPAVVVRGMSSTVALVEPWTTMTAFWPHRKPYAIDVAYADHGWGTDTLYFLADGGGHMGGGGFGSAHVTVTATFNTRYDVVDPTFSATASSTGDFHVTNVKTWAAPKPPLTKNGPTALSPRAASIDFDIVGATSTIGASAEVDVNIAGGELADLGREQKLKITLKTRVIHPPFSQDSPKGTSGADVAQLQLYLSQILCADRVPCYRADDAGSGNATIDGVYDTNSQRTRQALFRFAYTFSHQDVQTNQGSIAGSALAKFASDPATHALLVAPGKIDLKKKDYPPDIDAFLKRTELPGTKDSEWIVVDGPFIKRVVEVFASGAALPYAVPSVQAVLPKMTAAPDAPVDFTVDASTLPPRGLPWTGYQLQGRLKAEAEGAKPDEDVNLTVPANSAYTLRHGSSSGSTVAVKFGDIASAAGATFDLVWSASGSADASLKGTVTRTDTHSWTVTSGSFEAPREFSRPVDKTKPGSDIAVVQFTLSQAPRNPAAKWTGTGTKPTRGFSPAPPPPKKGAPAPPSGPVVVDGVWTGEWVKALREFASEWKVQGGSNAILVALFEKTFPWGAGALMRGSEMDRSAGACALATRASRSTLPPR